MNHDNRNAFHALYASTIQEMQGRISVFDDLPLATELPERRQMEELERLENLKD